MRYRHAGRVTSEPLRDLLAVSLPGYHLQRVLLSSCVNWPGHHNV